MLAEIRGLKFTVKGGEGSGWFAPPKGTHEGEAPSSQSDLERTVGAYLEDMGIPFEHTDGLSVSMSLPSRFYKEDKDGFWEWHDPIEGKRPGRTAATYNSKTQTIHISQGVFTGKNELSLGHVLSHEVGHHVHRNLLKNPLAIENKFGDKAVPAIKQFTNLHDFGLRKYSISSGRELIADSYRVWLRGNDSQFSNLQNMITKTTGYDLIKLFGERP